MTGSEVADRLELANQAAIDYIGHAARRHWEAVTLAEGWPVGVAARHIGLWYPAMTGWMRAMAAGEPIVVGPIHALNAEQAALGVVATPDEVVELLNSNGEILASAMRTLTEHHLAGEVDFGGERTLAAEVAEIAIAHVEEHLASIRAVAEADRQA